MITVGTAEGAVKLTLIFIVFLLLVGIPPIAAMNSGGPQVEEAGSPPLASGIVKCVMSTCGCAIALTKSSLTTVSVAVATTADRLQSVLGTAFHRLVEMAGRLPETLSIYFSDRIRNVFYTFLAHVWAIWRS